MAKTVNIYDAKTQLSRLVDQAVAGEEVVIARAGRPLVKLVPVEAQARKQRKFGLARGQPYWIAPDFDETPSEILEAMEKGIEPET